MILSDSHCHLHMLDLSDFDNNLDNVIKAANDVGVQHLLCVGTRLEDVPELLRLSHRYSQGVDSRNLNLENVESENLKSKATTVFASVGLHPNESADTEPNVEQLISLASNPKVIAIGETGLDYFRTEEKQPWQLSRFRTHIHAAHQLQKPLIIHTRAARSDTLLILREENAREVGGVFHCFTEDWETAKAGLDLGFYISFSGIVTFKNAVDLQEVAKKVPLDRILIETDCPFLAPNPHRGKMNHPAWVLHVAEFIAGLRKESVERIAEKTTENYLRLFFK